MVGVGQTIDNPAMGARLHVRRIVHGPGESMLEFDFFLRPGGVIAVDHLHPWQEERFEVVSGAVAGHVGGHARTVHAGGGVVVAPGVPHAWRNAADAETHLRVQFRPALRTAEFFDTVFALGRAGRTDERGVPRGPRRFAILAAFGEEVRPAGMPATVHRALVRLGRPFAASLEGR
jgi:quercetin dioxygenase-like cupin family protein